MTAADPSTLSPPFGQAPARIHDTPMAAACIGVATRTLALEPTRRRYGIARYKIGRRVVWREADLLAFLDRCRVEG